MKKRSILLSLLLIIFIVFYVCLYAETEKKKTDFRIGAKIIGVADPDYREYSYIDMGSAHGVKPGDRFMVEGKYGKVMVEVVQSFQRMSAVKIVDSWLLSEGNVGEMIPASRYPKIKLSKYIEKTKQDTVMASARVKPKKVQPKTPEKVEKPKETTKKRETLPEDVSVEALIHDESADMIISDFEEAFQEQSLIDTTGMETEGMDLLTDETLTEDALAMPEFGIDEMNVSADDASKDALLLNESVSEPALTDEPIFQFDDIGSEDPGIPSDEISIMPGDALPEMPY